MAAFRLLFLVLAWLPACVSSSKSAAAQEDRLVPEGRAQVADDEPFAPDCLVALDHVESHAARHLEKRPAALRKHSRRPSPSDDDGTCPDPTDEDDTSDNIMGADSTEGVVALWSPSMPCFLVISEGAPSLFPVPSRTSLFLVLKRFRC